MASSRDFYFGSNGGTVNNIITGNALGTDPDFFGGILTAAMVGFTIYLFFIFSAPSWMKKLGFKSEYETLDKKEAEEFYNNYWKEKSISLNGITAIISVAVIVTAASIYLKANVLDMPAEVYVATLTLIIANITKIGDINGSEEIGSYGFHLFFASLGGMISITALVKAGPMLLVMYLVSLIILAVIVFFVSKKMNISLEAICIASNAGVGGPTTAPVMAVAFGWKQLVLTGVVLGIFGYSFASYIGIGAAYLIKFIM
ncbi:DUF819 family protein [Salinicoccus roseus]|uniref:DUF819 family protein n=1 Tax=Salinicoccus roseus TaxID=45670 RepID=UPI00352674E9